MSRHSPDEQWIESTEGDLDPDLTEEAGYAGWEPSRSQAWWPALARWVGLAVLAALVLSVVLPAIM